VTAFLRLGAVSSIVAGLFLLAFWWCYVLFLPYGDLPSTRNLSILTKPPHWQWINVLGVLGSACAVMALPSLYLFQASSTGKAALIGTFIAFLGSILMVAPLCWDLVLWAPLANYDETILSFDGPIYRSKGFLTFFVSAGLLQAAGFAILGVATAKADVFPTWQGVMLAVGLPLFALGSLAGSAQAIPRSIGITVAAAAFAAMGYTILSRIDSVPK
jgi:hypothetical protein